MQRSIVPMPRHPRVIASCLTAAFLLAPPAWAEVVGFAPAGKDVASAWCANCHAFPGSTHATATGAPSFSAVAADRANTHDRLRDFLRVSHSRMPDMHLSNQELEDLIAFILASRGK